MKKYAYLIYSLLIIAIVGVSYKASAGDAVDIGNIVLPWGTSMRTSQDVMVRFINWFAGILGAAAVIGIIYAGVLYITGATTGSGDKKVAVAKKTLTWSVMGVVIAALSYIIVNEIIRVVR